MNHRTVHRHSIERKAIEEFGFPPAVALLLSTVFEPRADGIEYGAVIDEFVQRTQKKIRKALNELVDHGSLSETGRIEYVCLQALEALLKEARQQEIVDLVRRLENVKAICRGDSNSNGEEADQIRYLRVPEPKYVREGRPPFGRWR